MKKNFFKITAFLLAVVFTFLSFYNVYSFKYLDSVFKMKMFYEQEDNTVDVLVLGSSHIYQGFNTAVLWKEYGYAAYNLCGAAQPLWNTYYYLEEALKTQNPQVIILDVFTLSYTGEYGDTSYAIKNTYGLKWSQTKIDAIKTSFDMEKAGYQYFFEVLQYHSKYSDLKKTDFYPYQANKEMYENHKGFYCYYNSAAVKEKDLTGVEVYNEISEKNEEYLRKIIELAQSKNIPLIATVIPYDADIFHEGLYNTVQLIFDEYNVPFYNFVTDYKDVLAIDFKTDFADSQHLNHLGNTKVTHFFGDLLSANYDVPDRRGDPLYSSWDSDADVHYAQVYNTEVKKQKNLNTYAEIIGNKRYVTVITESVNDFSELSENVRKYAEKFFDKLGISEDEYTAGGMWVVRDGEVEYYNECKSESFTKSVKLSRFDTAFVDIEERAIDEVLDEETGEITPVCVYTKKIHSNKSDQTKISHGINIYVYDTLTQSTVDALGYNYSNGKLSR